MSVGDVRVVERRNPLYIEVHVKDRYLPEGGIYLFGEDRWPVSAILMYMHVQGRARQKEGTMPIFSSIAMAHH